MAEGRFDGRSVVVVVAWMGYCPCLGLDVCLIDDRVGVVMGRTSIDSLCDSWENGGAGNPGLRAHS